MFMLIPSYFKKFSLCHFFWSSENDIRKDEEKLEKCYEIVYKKFFFLILEMCIGVGPEILLRLTWFCGILSLKLN